MVSAFRGELIILHALPEAYSRVWAPRPHGHTCTACENNATNGFLKRPYHFSQDVEKQLVPRFGPGTSTCVALFSVWFFFFSPNENHSSSTWRTFLYRNLLPDNGSFLSAKLPPLKLNHNPLTLPHSETFLQPAKTEAGRGGTGREKLGIFVEGSSFFSLTIKWFGMSESQESYSCVSGCRLPYNFCFRPWVTVLTSQLAAMASLQVITKTGIRLHENLHVRDCCCLPQQNPQQRHHPLLSQVWHSELGAFEVTSPHFPRGRQAHTRDPHHTCPCTSFLRMKA